MTATTFMPNEEQLEIAAMVRQLLADRVPLDKLRDYDPLLGEAPPGWVDLAEMGVFGLAVDETYGGSGLGCTEQALVFCELGRALTPGPILGTVLAAHVASAAGRTDLAEALVAGSSRASLALGTGSGELSRGDPLPSGARLVHAAGTDLVCVCTPEWSGLLSAEDLAKEVVAGLDPAVPLSVTIAPGGAWLAVVEGPMTWWRGALLVAATQVGIASATLDLAVAHAKVREQFGVPIGSFQAVKHRAADMASRTEVARVQTLFAAAAIGSDEAAAARETSAARVVSSEAAIQNSADLIVTLGAMGFSDEHVAHLFARRAQLLDVLLGSQRWHLEVLARTP